MKFENLQLNYSDDDHKPVIDHFTYEFKSQKITTLIGENGCGKSTLLDYLAGLKPDVLASNTANSISCKTGYVTQNASKSLFSWMSPMENIIFPKKLRSRDSKNVFQKVLDIYNYFEFDWNWDSPTQKLSGGQIQKVALIRALYASPDLLLIDEGFGAIDFKSRNKTIEKLREWVKKMNITVINVSHHIAEALVLSDEVLVLESGKIKETITINLKDPRTTTIKENKEYGQYLSKLRNAIHE